MNSQHTAESSYRRMIKLIAHYSANYYENPGVGIFQVVKALELIFHPHFQMVTGSYSWVESLGGVDGESHQVVSIPYAWLAVNELNGVIINVMPVSQPANLKVPVLVMLKQKGSNSRNFGYFPGPAPNGSLREGNCLMALRELSMFSKKSCAERGSEKAAVITRRLAFILTTVSMLYLIFLQ